MKHAANSKPVQENIAMRYLRAVIDWLYDDGEPVIVRIEPQAKPAVKATAKPKRKPLRRKKPAPKHAH